MALLALHPRNAPIVDKNGLRTATRRRMKRSAGILAYRRKNGVELFLVHPGGPFWRNKDVGAWSIPKGEIEPEEEPLAAARREFREETGHTIDGTFAALDPV